MKALLILFISCFTAASCAQEHKSVADIALSFIDYPYVSASLETKGEERLVVNLEEFDCTTLVESCLALALADSVKPGDIEYQLQRIRYRNGIIDGYTSRLHYMADWIADNQNMGIIEDITCDIGGEPFIPNLYYMSENPHLYPHLKENKEEIEKIRKIEAQVNQRKDYCYIPKDKINEAAGGIADGDILFFTTSIAGLDVQHAGIAYRHNGRLGFIHASSRAGKVIVEPLSLSEYCKKQKTITGIIVVRLKT